MPKDNHTSQNYYRISPLSVPSDITSPHQYPSIAATMQSSMNSQQLSQADLSPYATGGPVQPLQYHQQSITQSAPLPVRASSGAWTPQDDAQLMSARAQGLNWQPIQVSYFPNKTPNACRKRHERLMDRRNSDDWDVIKLENMAKEYMGMRRELWTQLGNKTGEKWTVVEAKCMQSGLKNLQSAARACARRERLENPSHLQHHHHSTSGSGSSLLPVQHPYSNGDPHSADDSGIGLDELEGEYHSAAGDNGSVYGGQSGASLSPDDQEPTSSSGSRGGSGLGLSAGAVKLYPAPVRGMGGAGSSSNGVVSGGYDRAVDMGYGAMAQQQQQQQMRGPERNGYVGVQQQQQQRHHHQHQHHQQQNQMLQQQRPQYGMQQRLPSIDMGIGAIINRPPGSL